ncbi:hypothetical protein [Chromatium okenii]|jgi:hypothetical protein|uniref:Haemolysin-type calcium binding-related domain-containing protein n=1 Tax=Chromatium okenii TaxID=61644 RepID=A0A2S7XPF0_9GAMM|nr:hypothetical protein [Chromatium okenii]MBV5311326.1 hypothetical protein [Chromatium okenii]PQJ95605.1 hypothetical protein CXB77_15980 [Chromatium okenii]
MVRFRFYEQIATNNDDFLPAAARQTTFALGGNDTIIASSFTATDFSDGQFVAGGLGNDTYISVKNSTLAVIDTGGFDKLVINDYWLNNPNVYLATVENQHLFAYNLASGQEVLIANWLSEAGRIEEIQLADGVYSYSQILDAITKSSNFVENLTTADLVEAKILPAGTTADDLAEFFNYVIARESELSGTTTPVVTAIPIAVVLSPAPIIEIAGLDDNFYLVKYPDIAASGMDPDLHFATFGWQEGRDPNAWFDTDWYLMQNLDVAAAGLNPLEHYWDYGWKEGRNPSPTFNTNAYLTVNPDVAVAGVNPLEHWLFYGESEGRPLGF